MGIAALKKLNQSMPAPLKRAAAPFIRKQLVGNRVFFEQYEELRRAKDMSADESAARQLAKLRDLLAFAYENVPYYRMTFSEAGFDPAGVSSVDDLRKLPLLTKDVLRERFDDLQAPAITDYYTATTGGSTGAPVKVSLERSSIYRERAFIYSFWAEYGYDYQTSRLATFRGVDFGGRISKLNPLYDEVLLNPMALTGETLAEYLHAIDSFGCGFVQGYPSALLNFCRLLDASGARPKAQIKAALAISENLGQSDAAYIERVLGCPCRAFYGHSERAVFAEQVGPGPTYRFDPEYGVAEVVDHGDGNIVCTGFLNRRMPLVRYAVDDYATPAGNGAYLIEGHHSSVELIGAGGERVSAAALNFHDATFESISGGGYQLLQSIPGKAECRVLAPRELSASELAGIERSLQSKTGGAISWTVTQGVPFELTARGKAKPVVQHIGENRTGASVPSPAIADASVASVEEPFMDAEAAMNANTLKSIYERLPKGIKFAFAPIFIRKMVDAPAFKRQWKQLDEFDAMSEDERWAKQFALLKETLEYAYENVPYYKVAFDAAGFNPTAMSAFDDVKALPLLEKSDAIAAGDALYSTDASLKYYETFTGGSSGQALRVLLDEESIYRERAFVTHYLATLGYDPLKTKTVALWGHNKQADYYYSPLKNEIVISPFRLFDTSQTEAVCKDIRDFGAEFLMGYPSAITQLARNVRQHGIDLSFSHIVYYAENYLEEDKRIAEETFGCKADSYYGHTERAVFAQIVDGECAFNDAYGYTELIPTDEPNEYRIVCTGFISRKMPLIRYATDDHIIVDARGVKRLVGHKRSDVYLVAKGGAHIFKGALTLHVPELSAITRYQYYQDTPGKVVLRLMTERELSPAEMGHLQGYLDRRTEGLLDVSVEYVDQIELTSRGKERWAICDIPAEKLGGGSL